MGEEEEFEEEMAEEEMADMAECESIDSVRSLRCAVKNSWRSSRSENSSMAVMLTGPPFSSVSSGSTMVIGPEVPGSPGRSVTTSPSMML